MGREFCINCPADEQQDLRLAAGYLEKNTRCQNRRKSCRF